MTDNEIIKALECCAEPVGINCVKCPFEKDCLEINMCEIALDLINRQKAEIRKYKNCYEQVKWERDLFEEQCKTAKAEAIKEFVERLYKLDTLIVCNGTYITDFDDILKLRDEMVGDNDDK